ncbi:histidine kinase [Rhodovulum sp. NI22]|nr:histidine kinase [Rhodovulum sp. NI22]
MQHDSNICDALKLNPLPALALEIPTGRIAGWNECAMHLFDADLAESDISRFSTSTISELAVFFEAVVHFGRYIDATLAFRRADSSALRLQVFGQHIPAEPHDLIMLTFLDLDVQNRRNERAEQDAHYRAGLMQWRTIYGFFQEIESQNQLILEAAGEGIYGINAEGKATFVNRAAQEMLGWNAEDLIGRELHSIIHHTHLNGDLFPADTCPIYESFRRDKTVRVEDDVFWRKDGKPILVEYVSTPIYDRGVLAGAVVIFRDVTERKENEKKLRDALAEVDNLRLQLEQENDYLITEIRSVRSHSGLVGRSTSIRNLAAQIDLVADTKTNVLITGPAGTGKSLAVSAIHEASERRKRPLIRVNCSDVSLQRLEAEFFGYRKGAFRGANRDTVGKITLAAHGTLHLDEVSDLPKEFQAKLIAVIQERKYRRIGDTLDTPIDLTIISTTSRDLTEEVHAGRFRQDLFFELSVFPIRCDALRFRPDDIPYLANHFLEVSLRRLRLPPTRLSKANIEALLAYDWPGNVRELENVIERAAILAQGGKMRFEFHSMGEEKPEPVQQILTDADLRRFERENLIRCLRRSHGKVSGAGGAAQLLGLPPTTVYSRINSFGIGKSEWSSFPAGAS